MAIEEKPLHKEQCFRTYNKQMTYQVFARKWRPQKFEDVIGQEHVTHTLTNAIRSERLAHAYLFGGPRGVGKTSVARILAKAINCRAGEPGNPCNKCRSCTEITQGSSVDVQEIDGASNRGIDEIRELRENIRYMPTSSRYRVYIIDEVHMLTLQAFNALLKTLEEPPGHVKFIFATTESHKVPVTILSRCQRFDFKRIPLDKIAAQLERITKEEGIQVTRSGLLMIARAAEGSMRDAESLLDQVVSFTGPQVADKVISEVLGIIDRQIVEEASEAIIDGSAVRCLQIVDQIYKYGYDIKEFYRALMERFRDLLLGDILPPESALRHSLGPSVMAEDATRKAGVEKLQFILNFLITKEEALRFTSHPRLFLEVIMIKLCRMGDYLSFAEILGKIHSLEQRLSGLSKSNPVSAGGTLSDPGGQWEGENSSPGPTGDRSPVNRETGWNGFLEHLASKNRAMSNVLKEWEFLSLDPQEGTLRLKKGARPFSSSYFDDKEQMDRLLRHCREYFQKMIRIEMVDNNPNAGQERHRKHQDPGDSDLPSTVKEILHIFQGEILGGARSQVPGAGRIGPNSGKRREQSERSSEHGSDS